MKEILNNFDFQSVHTHMIATNWAWVHKEGERLALGVPSLERIKETAIRLLSIAETHKRAEAGGFVASVTDKYITLTFSNSNLENFNQPFEVTYKCKR